MRSFNTVLGNWLRVGAIFGQALSIRFQPCHVLAGHSALMFRSAAVPPIGQGAQYPGHLAHGRPDILRHCPQWPGKISTSLLFSMCTSPVKGSPGLDLSAHGFDGVPSRSNRAVTVACDCELLLCEGWEPC